MPNHDRAPVVQAVLSGMTHRDAATKYGVPSGNVARWVREHNAAPLRLAPDPARESAPRAREVIRGRDVRASAMAEALGPQLRTDLRDTIGNLTAYLADVTGRARGGEAVDMHQVAAGARALDALLSRAADVLAFDERTAAPDERPPDLATPEGEAAVLAQLDALPHHLLVAAYDKRTSRADAESVAAEVARRRRPAPPHC